MKRGVQFAALGLVFVTGAGFLFLRPRKEDSGPIIRMTTPGIAPAHSELPVQPTTPAEVRQQVTSSLASETVPSMAQSQTFTSNVAEWVEAYASPDPEVIAALMERSGIDRPSSWTSPAQTSEGWGYSTIVFRQVLFDASKATIFTPGRGIHPYAGKNHMCGTRDAARAVLKRGGDPSHLMTREAILDGAMVAPSGEAVTIGFGITMAWDSVLSRWVPIRTCFYNLPPGVEGRAPVL